MDPASDQAAATDSADLQRNRSTSRLGERPQTLGKADEHGRHLLPKGAKKQQQQQQQQQRMVQQQTGEPGAGSRYNLRPRGKPPAPVACSEQQPQMAQETGKPAVGSRYNLRPRGKLPAPVACSEQSHRASSVAPSQPLSAVAAAAAAATAPVSSRREPSCALQSSQQPNLQPGLPAPQDPREALLKPSTTSSGSHHHTEPTGDAPTPGSSSGSPEASLPAASGKVSHPAASPAAPAEAADSLTTIATAGPAPTKSTLPAGSTGGPPGTTPGPMLTIHLNSNTTTGCRPPPAQQQQQSLQQQQGQQAQQQLLACQDLFALQHAGSCSLKPAQLSSGKYLVLNPLGGADSSLLRGSSFSGFYPDLVPATMEAMKQQLAQAQQQAQQQPQQLPAGGEPYRVLDVVGDGGQGLVLSVVRVGLEHDAHGSLHEVWRDTEKLALKLLFPPQEPPYCSEQDCQQQETSLLKELALSLMPLSPFVVQAELVGVAWLSLPQLSLSLTRRGSTVVALPAMLMPLAERSLQDFIEELRQPKPDGSALQQLLMWAWCVGRGLSDMHRHGVVHRDFKAANAGMFPDGLKLLDLGSARLAHLKGKQQHSPYKGTKPGIPPEFRTSTYLELLTDVSQLLPGMIASLEQQIANSETTLGPSSWDSSSGAQASSSYVRHMLVRYLGKLPPQQCLEAMRLQLAEVQEGLARFGPQPEAELPAGASAAPQPTPAAQQELEQQFLAKADAFSFAMLLLQLVELSDLPFGTKGDNMHGDTEQLQWGVWMMLAAVGPKLLLSAWLFEDDPQQNWKPPEQLMGCGPDVFAAFREVAEAGLRAPWRRSSVTDMLGMSLFRMLGRLLAGSLADADEVHLPLLGTVLRDWAAWFPQEALELCSQQHAAIELAKLAPAPNSPAGGQVEQVKKVQQVAHRVANAAQLALLAGLDVDAAVRGALTAP